ncbi:MAG: protein kinase, partial [Calditrichaeota bacterium]|nr:protein kinase [Calditrichota bacterium]
IQDLLSHRVKAVMMIGKSILHYKILEKLGEGGMGVVYLAEDTKLERKVAIKFLPHHIAANSDERKRFEIEAKAAAALNHPNIATIHAIEEADNPSAGSGREMFLVMEYIEGKELKDLVRGKQSSTETSEKTNIVRGIASPLQIATQIAKGLQAAHEKGIIHRDIKSSNIMLTKDNQVKIMDFGLAKIGGGEEITNLQTTVGTIAFMSPEQTQGSDVDSRTDIWSFGIVLYEMLTGDLPFKGAYDQAIIYSILNEEPDYPAVIKDDPLLYKIVQKALQKNPDERYQSVSEIINALQSTVESDSTISIKKIPGDIKKLAVLPFINLKDDPQSNFLGFAIADQIIGAMAYSKNVLIRPSSMVRKYQNEIIDIQQAAEQLNVSFIVAGNYLKEADIIRLNIELVDHLSGDLIWRDSIQIEYKNVFELQDIVSQKVVKELKVHFSDEERERMKPETPQDPQAYDYYLRAISLPFTVDGNKTAIDLIEKAIELDPLYAPLYLDLGIRFHQLAQVGSDTAHALEKSEKALLKALSLKNDLLPALANLGLIYSDIGKHEEAHKLLIRALKINPNHAWLHFAMSYHYRYIGFLEESEKELNLALAIDANNPRFRSGIVTLMFLGKYDQILEKFNLDKESPFMLNYLGEVAFRAGKKDLAIDYFNRVVNIDDEIGELYFAQSFIAYLSGDMQKAVEYNNKRGAENPADGEIWYEIARLYGLFSKVEDCYQALKKSVELGYLSYPSMSMDFFLDPVKHDPKIQQQLSETESMFQDLKNKLETDY